jgi:hypothetical protein
MIRHALEVPKKSAFTIETHADFIKLHTLCIASGKRGGGKSVAIANLVKVARDRGYFDRVIVVTPTYFSNRSIWDICYINRDPPREFENGEWHIAEYADNPDAWDVVEPNAGCIRYIQEWVEHEAAQWDEFIECKRHYAGYLRDIRKYPTPDTLPPDKLITYTRLRFFERGPPVWKYALQRAPRLAVIVDDCLGTPIISHPSEGLLNLCIKHRHIGKGLGFSLFLLTQTYCSVGGVPRPIRENCTLLLLFEQTDENQREKEFREIGLSSYITREEFDRMLRHCTEKPYGFLTIDMSPKVDRKRFMKNFERYIPTTKSNPTIKPLHGINEDG